MPNDVSEAMQDAPLVLAWSMPGTDAYDGWAGSGATWLAGGVMLAVWTVFAVLLTST